jgi:8-oxo-dGTP diphosphatase
MDTDARPELQSAGAVVVAASPEGPLVALLHRRAPDEWRLAKGKLDPGETHEQAAQREVAEELGVQVPVGARLGETHYTYRSPGGPRSKSVVFFLAPLPAPAPLTPEARHFDQAVWVSPAEALRRLSWENERKMLGLALASLPGSTEKSS